MKETYSEQNVSQETLTTHNEPLEILQYGRRYHKPDKSSGHRALPTHHCAPSTGLRSANRRSVLEFYRIGIIQRLCNKSNSLDNS